MSEIFREVSLAESKHIMTELKYRRATITFKLKGSKVFKAKVESRSWGKNLGAERPADYPMELNREQVTGSFLIKTEVYFFQAMVVIEGKNIIFIFSGPLFQLYRRKSQRVKLTTNFPIYFLTRRIGSSLIFLKGVLVDLSQTGCKVAVNVVDPEIKAGDKIAGDLRIGARRLIPIEAEVRHCRKTKQGRFSQVFGIRFVNVTPDTHKKIVLTVIDAQRDMLSRQEND